MKLRFAASMLVLFAAIAAMATPFKETVTVTAGVGTLTIGKDYVGRAVTHVQIGCLAGVTGTVSVVSGSYTNTLGTKVVAANDALMIPSNTIWLFKGDSIRITCGDTNTFTAVVVGNQQ